MLILLAVIYITFISLGLPDSIFGAAWPVMHEGVGVPVNAAGIYMIVTGICSGCMSFGAGWFVRRLGTCAVTVFSVFLTAAGLLLTSFAPSFGAVLAGGVLSGLGAGAIDTALNNYVSLHYRASHMNWLHAFWGVGVTVSPFVMSAFLSAGNDWRGGYLAVAIMQFCIAGILVCTIPVWRKHEREPALIMTESDVERLKKCAEIVYVSDYVPDVGAGKEEKPSAVRSILHMRGLVAAVLSLGFYCALEFTVGTWGASYMVRVKEISAASAALWISFYFGGITAGRFLSGFLSYRLNDRQLIRVGTAVAAAGILVTALPIGTYSLAGFVLAGMGFGPVFPSVMHATASRFGTEFSADVTGIQAGGAYAVGWVIQLAFGYVAAATTFAFMPYLLLVLVCLLFAASEIANVRTSGRTGT